MSDRNYYGPPPPPLPPGGNNPHDGAQWPPPWGSPPPPPPPPPKKTSVGMYILVGCVGVAVTVLACYMYAPPKHRAAEAAADKFRDAAAAFNGAPVDDNAPEIVEIRATFNAVQKAVRMQDNVLLEQQFDFDRMIDEINAAGVKRRIHSDERRGMLQGIHNSIPKTLAMQQPLTRVEGAEIKRCVLNNDGSEALVYYRTARQKGEVSIKFRWWLKHTGARWQIYDIEELSTGFRISSMMAVTFNELVAGRDQVVLAEWEKLRTAMQALSRKDFDAVEQTLPTIREENLGEPMQAMYHLAEARNHFEHARLAQALTACDAAERLQPDLPVVFLLRARVDNAQGHYDEAVANAEHFLQLLGADVEGYRVLAEASLGLDQKQAAADAYRKALDDQPEAVDLLALAALLPDDEKGEIGERFAKFKDPAAEFSQLLEGLKAENDEAGRTALMAAMRNIAPNHPGLSAAESVTDDLEPNFPDEALSASSGDFRDISAAVGRLKAAIRARDREAVAKLFDVDRLAAEIVHQGTARTLPTADRRGLASGGIKGWGNALAKDDSASWAELRVTRIVLATGGRTARVAFRHWAADTLDPIHETWWFFKTGGEWRCFDTDEYGSMMRYSQRLAIAGFQMAKQATGRHPLLLAAEARHNGKYDDAETELKKLDPKSLQGAAKNIYPIVSGELQWATRQGEEAVASFERAAALQPKVAKIWWMRAKALNAVGRYGEAKDCVEKYRAAYGDDADGQSQLGLALAGLGKNAEAAAAFRTGLEDSPNSADLIGLLTKVLPADDMREVGSWFAKMPRPATQFEVVLHAIRTRRHDEQAVAAVIAEMKRIDPDGLDLLREEGWMKYREKDYAAAAAIAERGLERATGDAKLEFQEQLLEFHLANKTALKAYAVVPDKRAAFKQLADELSDSERTPELLELIAAHRANDPEDLWLAYYEGDMFSAKKEWDKASERYRFGLDKSKDDGQRNEFRSSLVFTLFQAGKAVEALDQVAPREAVFRQLMQLADNEKDTTAQEQLLAAQRKALGDESAAAYWDAKISWHKRDYAGVVRILSAGKLADSEKFDAERMWIKSLIKLEDYPAAEKRIATLKPDDEKDFFALVVAASRKQVPEATAIADRIAGRRKYTPLWWWYSDDVLGPLLRSGPFQAFREKYPEPKPETETDNDSDTKPDPEPKPDPQSDSAASGDAKSDSR